jgi:hypothetical protein
VKHERVARSVRLGATIWVVIAAALLAWANAPEIEPARLARTLPLLFIAIAGGPLTGAIFWLSDPRSGFPSIIPIAFGFVSVPLFLHVQLRGWLSVAGLVVAALLWVLWGLYFAVVMWI